VGLDGRADPAEPRHLSSREQVPQILHFEPLLEALNLRSDVIGSMEGFFFPRDQVLGFGSRISAREQAASPPAYLSLSRSLSFTISLAYSLSHTLSLTLTLGLPLSHAHTSPTDFAPRANGSHSPARLLTTPLARAMGTGVPRPENNDNPHWTPLGP